MDTGDDTIELKLLYIFARTVVGKNATNLFYAVRRELGAKGFELFKMFMDCLSGADLSWGYDLSIKLRQDVARELAQEQAMERAMADGGRGEATRDGGGRGGVWPGAHHAARVHLQETRIIWAFVWPRRRSLFRDDIGRWIGHGQQFLGHGRGL